MKKLITLCLVVVMVFSMAVPAFADGNSITYTTGVIAPTVSVVLSNTSSSIVLNPYGLTCKVADFTKDATATGEDATNLTVLNNPITVLNTGDTKVSVLTTATGAQLTNKTVTFVTAPFDDTCGTAVAAKTVATKSVFMFVKMAKGTWDSEESEYVSPFADAATTQAQYVVADDILVKAGAVAAKTATVLDTVADAAHNTASALTADDFANDNAPVMEVLIAGQANGKSSSLWTSEDGVTVDIVFTLTPTV